MRYSSTFTGFDRCNICNFGKLEIENGHCVERQLHGTLENGRIVEFQWKVMKAGRNDENSDKIRKIHDPVENDLGKSRPSGKWSRKKSQSKNWQNFSPGPIVYFPFICHKLHFKPNIDSTVINAISIKIRLDLDGQSIYLFTIREGNPGGVKWMLVIYKLNDVHLMNTIKYTKRKRD